MSESNATDIGDKVLEIRLPNRVAAKLTAVAKAVGKPLEEFVEVVLTRHAHDPFGLRADVADAVDAIEIPGLQDAPVEICEPDRFTLVCAATAAAQKLSMGGDEADARTAVREFSGILARNWGDETYEDMVAYALDVATDVWERLRAHHIGK